MRTVLQIVLMSCAIALRLTAQQYRPAASSCRSQAMLPLCSEQLKSEQSGVREAPLQGPNGPTYAFTINQRIVLVRGDTTYLRHEMLHHILSVGGWQPPTLQSGEHYSIADLHPMPLFGLCTGGA